MKGIEMTQTPQKQRQAVVDESQLLNPAQMVAARGIGLRLSIEALKKDPYHKESLGQDALCMEVAIAQLALDQKHERATVGRIYDKILVYLEERKNRSFVPSMIIWIKALKERELK
jgi:hypothetical protein